MTKIIKYPTKAGTTVHRKSCEMIIEYNQKGPHLKAFKSSFFLDDDLCCCTVSFTDPINGAIVNGSGYDYDERTAYVLAIEECGLEFSGETPDILDVCKMLWSTPLSCFNNQL